MNDENIQVDTEEILEQAYSKLKTGDILVYDDIKSYIERIPYSKIDFGWRFFEFITKKTKNCQSPLYSTTLTMLKKWTKLFPVNHNLLKNSYKRMVANMILGLGQTGFKINSKYELDKVLDDFKDFEFEGSSTDVIQIIFEKLVQSRSVLSRFYFKKLCSFMNLELNLNNLLSSGIEESIVVGLLAEKHLINPIYRFRQKLDYDQINFFIGKAKEIRNGSPDSQKKRKKLYFDALLIAMGYDEKIIRYCFANYFYSVAALHDNQGKKNLASLCYEYASIFFKLLENDNLKYSSKAYYYNCLSFIYMKERRYEDQERALAGYVKNLKKLYNLFRERYERVYYLSVLRFYYYKIKNALYRKDDSECYEICKDFLSKEQPELKEVLNERDFEEKVAVIKAYQAQSQANLLREQNNLNLALKYLKTALNFHQSRTRDLSIKEIKHVEREILYLQARVESAKGHNIIAGELINQLLSFYQSLEFAQEEYVIFSKIIECKMLIEKGKIRLSIPILKEIIENVEIIKNSEELYNISKEIYDCILNIDNFNPFMENIDDKIENITDKIENFKIIKIMDFDLPIQKILCNYLYLDIEDDYCLHLIFKYEKKLGIKFPRNYEYYPIFEYIILSESSSDDKTNEYAKKFMHKDQQDPLHITHKGMIIDGNKRLAAIKIAKLGQISKLEVEEKDEELFKVNIVRFPETFSTKEIIEFKADVEYRPILEEKKEMDFNKFRTFQKLIEINTDKTKIRNMLNLEDPEIQFYKGVANLVEEFLINNAIDGNFYIIHKYDIFKHFTILYQELFDLGIHTGITGTDLINLKEQLKNLTFIWLQNNIDEHQFSQKKILKTGMIKKIKFIFMHPGRKQVVNKILNREINDKEQVHLILHGLIKNIKIPEEKRSSLDHARLLYERITRLQDKIKFSNLSSKEIMETTDFLNKTEETIKIVRDDIAKT